MAVRVRNPRDLGAAVVFGVIGLAGLLLGRDYVVGTAARMGPGYLPQLLSWLLIAFGCIIATRSLVVDGSTIEPVRVRATILVLLSIVAFGLVVVRLGFGPAVLVATVLAALATAEARIRESIILSIVFAAFCVLVFIYGLRQPFPIFAGP